jgi:hypothetical protein
MKSKLVGLGLGIAAMATLGVVAAPAVAYADSTCYTGCAGTTGGTVPPQVVTATTVAPPVEPKAASSGLAFTGADIEGMAAIGAGALVVGGALVRRSRRQRQVQATA